MVNALKCFLSIVAGYSAKDEVLPHGHRFEQLASLRAEHQTIAHQRGRGRCGHDLAVEGHRAAGCAQKAACGEKGRGFAHAIRTQQGDDFASADTQADAMHDFMPSVRYDELVDFNQHAGIRGKPR